MIKTGCFLFLILLVANASAAVPNVKVLIAKSLQMVQAEGVDLHRKNSLSNKSNQILGRSKIKFNCINKAKSNLSRPVMLASLSSPTGLVKLNEKHYFGEVHLTSSHQGSNKDGCDLINEVPIETYLSSLLSKEMNALWPLEALKAQAVAARSFALDKIRTNVKDSFYDLESSEKDQVSGSFFDATKKTPSILWFYAMKIAYILED